MKLIDPDDKKELHHFYLEWKSCYTEKNYVKPPNITSMRILFQYGTYGCIPGDFIMSVLENNLYNAFATALPEDMDSVYGTVQYVLIRLPMESYGSPEKVTKWVERMKKSKMFRPTTLY